MHDGISVPLAALQTATAASNLPKPVNQKSCPAPLIRKSLSLRVIGGLRTFFPPPRLSSLRVVTCKQAGAVNLRLSKLAALNDSVKHFATVI